MTDRLKQIWSTFEGKTQRNLTGRGVDNIPRVGIEERQHQQDMRTYAASLNQNTMPEGVTEPAQAAFAALKANLTSFDDRGKPVKKTGRHPLPDPSVQDQSFDANFTPYGQMMQDLRSTEIRTTRREGDFDQWLAASEARGEGRRKRKKFFGIF